MFRARRFENLAHVWRFLKYAKLIRAISRTDYDGEDKETLDMQSRVLHMVAQSAHRSVLFSSLKKLTWKMVSPWDDKDFMQVALSPSVVEVD